MPAISVIVPTYNQAAYLPETLESLLAQTGVELEIIVVNDGSTDGTKKVIQNYSSKVTVIEQTNSGVPASLNRAIKKARHDWISWIASDNVLPPS